MLGEIARVAARSPARARQETGAYSPPTSIEFPIRHKTRQRRMMERRMNDRALGSFESGSKLRRAVEVLAFLGLVREEIDDLVLDATFVLKGGDVYHWRCTPAQ
jgi:hypothetical protein